jgi:type IV pilus assembly protein PilA
MRGHARARGQGRPNGDAGFTLIELMVVVLIIGILIGIALPTFLGARTRAADRATQSDLRNALAAALTYQAGKQDFNGFDVAAANLAENGLNWVPSSPPGTPPQAGEISIQVAQDDELLLVGLSQSGAFYCVAQLPNAPATSYGKGAQFSDLDTVGECDQGWSF